MIAKQMKELLATVDDNAVLLVSEHDHGFRTATFHVTTAVAYPDGQGRATYSEDFGPLNDEGGKIVPALIIS